jgi:flagellar protein FlbD
MISLTRLNGHPLVINSDLIKFVEASPDTMLTLIHGEKVVVLESCDEVIGRVTQYRVKVIEALLRDCPDAMAASSAAAAQRVQVAVEQPLQRTGDEIIPDLGAAQRRRGPRA